MAVTGTILLTATASATATAIATGTMAAFATNFLVAAALGAAMHALTPKPSPSGVNRGYDVNGLATGTALDHQIIYGKARVGGVRIYDESTGTDNKYLHRIIAFTGHEIQSFENIYVNDEVVTLDSNGFVTSPTHYNSKIRIKLHLGASDQTADSTLVAESAHWTSAHRLRGISYLYVRMEYDTDSFPDGIPNFTATIKGKKVYDPRNSTTAWSANPALCIRDYLTSSYGLSEAVANIDDALVATAANVCDQTNTIANTTRYTCNGGFTTGSTPYEMLSSLLTSMGGSLWYAQGKWRMKPAYWTTPVMDLNEDDLRGSISLSTRHSRRDNFNTIKGTFKGEESNWQVTDYPEVTNSAFVTADNGQVSVADVDLGFTDDSIGARRLSRITLERNRQQLTVGASFGLRTLGLQVGDNVRITNSRFGWTNKEFEVVQWSFGLSEDLDLQVNMTLRETAETVFDEVSDGIVYERDNTTFWSPFEVEIPQTLQATPSTFNNADGTTIPQVLFSWASTNDSVIEQYEFQWKISTDTDYNSVILTNKEFLLSPIKSGVAYNYRVRSINHLGVKSSFVSGASPISTINDATIPNPPTSLNTTGGYGNAGVYWTPPTTNTDSSTIDDLFQYKVYRNTANNFGTATLVGRVASDAFTDTGLADETLYYYWVTALDFTGNESSESSVVSVTTAVAPTGPAGDDGARGAGRWNIQVSSLPTTSSGADTDFTAAIGDPVDRDQAWFYTGTQANPTSQNVWIYNLSGDSWVQQTEVIDGSLVVSGTVTADRLESQVLSTLGLTIGTLSSSASGERIVISDDKILVYDASNTIRVKIGNLA